MKKRGFLFSLLVGLSVILVAGFGCGPVSTVCATKSNVVCSKEKLKHKIINAKKVVGLIQRQRERGKKLKESFNNYIQKKDMYFQNFEDQLIEKLIVFLNENVIYSKSIMKNFGCNENILDLIFRNDENETLTIKFKKVKCCPEIMVEISRKFNSVKVRNKFVDDLGEMILREEKINEKIFLSPYLGDNTCKMCIVLMDKDTV